MVMAMVMVMVMQVEGLFQNGDRCRLPGGSPQGRIRIGCMFDQKIISHKRLPNVSRRWKIGLPHPAIKDKFEKGPVPLPKYPDGFFLPS